MLSRWKSPAFFLACLVFLLVLAACGSGGPPVSTPTSTSMLADQTTPLTASVPAFPSDGLLATPTLPHATNKAIQRVEHFGPGEVVPGFGGWTRDRDDMSIVYVYMLDPSQQAQAEKAAQIVVALGSRSQPPIREVRVLQGDYSWGQLEGWYRAMRDPIWQIEGLSTTDITESLNRITLTYVARPGVRQEVQDLLRSLDIPLEAVIIKVGCQDVGAPYRPVPLPDDSVLRSLKVWVESPSEVKLGEPVVFTLTVQNPTEHAVKIETGEPPTPDFAVTSTDGVKVWSRSCEMGFRLLVARTVTLEPGEEAKYQATWRQWDGQGGPITPGEYGVYGVLDTHPRLPAEPVTFRVVP